MTYVPPEQILVIPGQINQLLVTDLPAVETAAQLEDFEMVILPKSRIQMIYWIITAKQGSHISMPMMR